MSDKIKEERLRQNGIFEKEFRELSEDTQTYQKYMYSMVAKSELDLMFIVDCTGSMSSWIRVVQMEILQIVEGIRKKFKTCCIRLCFVGYRDLKDKNRFEIMPFENNWRKFKQFVSNVQAQGGDDFPEDVFGGLKNALDQKWASSARYAIFIADAPGHGAAYSKNPQVDNYPNGDPSGEDLEHFMVEFAQKRINLFAAKISDETDKMINLLSDNYHIHSGKYIEQANLGNSTKGFSSFIIKTALEIIEKDSGDNKQAETSETDIYYRILSQMRINTLYCLSNKIFVEKYDKVLNSTIKQIAKKADENVQINNFDKIVIRGEDSQGSLNFFKKKIKKLFSKQNNGDNQAFNAKCYTFEIQKEDNSIDFIAWNKPLIINKTIKQTTILLSTQLYQKGKNNLIFKLEDQKKPFVCRIPIKIAQQNEQNLEYFIEINKDRIIAQHILRKMGIQISFCIYEIIIEGKNHFLSSEDYIQSNQFYNSQSCFQPCTFDEKGLQRQVIAHFSYEYTLGQYMIANYNCNEENISNQGFGLISQPLVYSLDYDQLANTKNQSYIGIFKFFINHQCSEQCSNRKLIDIQDFSDSDKMNFKLPLID